ncbi:MULTISPECIES: porin [unclassified Pseudomonas]|uniref:porin n=1 Tax=unclassified Pseudomonas TaxID=196821 RepID=UPI0015B47F43|nr:MULTISPECIES: porin [unclassified Pseudomonas]
MLKQVAVGTLCICAGEASAQFEVKPYGVLDVYGSYSHAGSISQSRIQSGGASTSRLGLLTTYDFNDDWRLSGILESGIDLIEGEFLKRTPFNREAHVKLESKSYGTLTYGRQYSASIGMEDDPFLAVSRFSPFVSVGSNVSGLGAGGTALGSRISRAISYTTPTVKSTRVQFLYSPNQATGPDEVGAENLGLLTIYDDSQWRLGAGYNRVRRIKDVAFEGKALEHVDTHMLTSVVGYHFPMFYGNLGFNYYKPDSPNARAAQIYSVGLVYPQTKYALRAGIYKRDVSGLGNVANAIAIGGEYHLTSQWDVYFRASFVENRNDSKFTTNAIELEEPGADPSAVGIGVRMRF